MAISDWWRALWTPTAQPPLAPAAHPDVAKHVALAEEAYDRMVDAREPTNDHDAAQRHFAAAIAAAQRLGLADEAVRLSARRDAVTAAHDSQRGGR
jgi:hypothetical protein